MICRICGKENGDNFFIAKEMMHGIRDDHEYMKCDYCGSIIIKTIPDDLGKYYKTNYYSLNNGPTKTFIDKLGLRKFMDGIVCWRLFKHTNANKNSRILDVGCGNGFFMNIMYSAGYKNVVGLDPNAISDTTISGLPVLKKILNDIDGSYDIILFRHSIEHLDDPNGALKKANELLLKNGVIIIVMPIADSYAWHKYREYWVQLDAPRHLNILSKNGIIMLAEKNNLKIYTYYYNSTKFQFIGSELYLRGIPLNDKDKYPSSIYNNIYYKIMAGYLNFIKRGDTITLYLKKDV